MRRKLLIFAVMLFCMLSLVSTHVSAQAGGVHLLLQTTPNPQPGPAPSSIATTTIPASTSTPTTGTTSTVACSTISIPQTNINTGINTAIELSVLALLVSIAVIAIGYMISKLLPTSGLGRWIDQEIYEVTKTAILIAGIYALLSLLGSVAVLLSGGTSGTSAAANFNTLAGSANTYLCNVQTNIATNFAVLVDLTNDVGVLQTMKVYYAIPIPTPWITFETLINFNPYSGSLFLNTRVLGSPFANLLNDLMLVISIPVIYIVNLESFILPDMVVMGLAVLIPMGLVFRAFPLVRGIGGTLIAIGIGIAIIFPAVLAIFNQNVSNVIGPALLQVPSITYSSTGNLFLDASVDLLKSTVGQVFSQASAFAAVMQSLVNIYGVINMTLGYNIYIIIQFLLFVIDLMIVVPIVRSIAAALGGSVRLGLGKRMKLV